MQCNEDGRDAETQCHEDRMNHSAAGSRGEFILCELGLNKTKYQQQTSIYFVNLGLPFQNENY